ncbi:PWI domain-containing protein [Neocallimastix lanati (nom. inval.)]|uniref:PWI domain-containing protein n=1 Tax=Neocallimastix californiae TaxID=1754190 RepID=A0A1Y2AD74_9FUNG|nr:PWI domain-containing protein [Neocallimastix sp. JGI-2020a]ORY20456.1 PWI domain-containing protein [Neocallimastix californiae]|eukprot:ORY20456.1 PWI domain-containing protein [Neocallimastix californiae]
MGDGGFFKGTSSEQDNRFSDKTKKQLKNMHFPSIFNKKVNLKKVHMETIQQWIRKKVIEILGMEDDVLINYIYETLEESPNPDPKLLQLNLTGFLEKNAASFVHDLWKLLLSAQENIGGIPKEFIEEKIKEIQKQEAERLRIMNEIKLKREKEENERRELEKIREKERKVII